MSRGAAYGRIGLGLLLLIVMYMGPQAYGMATAGDKLQQCLRGTDTPHDVTVALSFIPGPTQIEQLQRYGRYGGSGGDLHNVVLLGAPPGNIDLLARLYWVDHVDPAQPC